MANKENYSEKTEGLKSFSSITNYNKLSHTGFANNSFKLLINNSLNSIIKRSIESTKQKKTKSNPTNYSYNLTNELRKSHCFNKKLKKLIHTISKSNVNLVSRYNYSEDFLLTILQNELPKVEVSELKQIDDKLLIDFEDLLAIDSRQALDQSFTFLNMLFKKDWTFFNLILDELVVVDAFQFGCAHFQSFKNRFFDKWSRSEILSQKGFIIECTPERAIIGIKMIIKRHQKCKPQEFNLTFNLNQKFGWWVIDKINSNDFLTFK